ncbi:unnamed protein product [Lampetra fluviatilis]
MAPHAATGFSPFYLMYGREPDPPVRSGGHRALVALGELCDPGQLHAALADVESGLRSWAVDPAVCDLDQQLKLFISRHSARSSAQVKGEKTLQHRSDVLETSVLLNPSENTLVGEVRALLLSPEHHKLLLLAGVGLEDTGDLVLQDGFFSCRHLLNICTDDEVQESLSAAFPEQRAELTLCCSVVDSASWGSLPSDGGVVSSALAVAVNPPALLPPGMEGACELSEYLAESWEAPSPFGVLEAPASGGFLKLSRPCCYVFPGGRGDAALFAINGFTLLVDGGSERRAGFWKLARHLDRLDALLLTHIGADNLPGVNALLERKVAEAEAQGGGEGGRPPGATSPEWLRNLVSPELGVVFFNVPDKMGQSGDPAANVRRGLDEACVTLQHLSQLGIQPEPLFRTNSPTLEPIILFQKLGVGRLEMYVLNPVKDSKEMQFMLRKWNGNGKAKSGVVMPNGKEGEVSVPYLTSVAVLLVWHPASPTERIVRTLFPGNAPQNKILEGLEKLKHLEVLKHPVVTQRDLASGAAAQAKPFQLKPKNRTDSKESLKMSSRSGTAKKGETAAMVRVDSKTDLAKMPRAEKTQAIPAAVKSSAAGRPDTGNKAGADRAKAEVKPKVAKEPAIGKDGKDKLHKPTKKDIKKEESKDDKKDVKDTKTSKEVKKDVKPVKKPELKASASDAKKPLGKTTAPRKDSADVKKPVALAAKATEAKKTKVQIKAAKPKGKADQIATAAKEQTPISSPEDLTKDFDEVKKDGVEFKQSTEEIIPSPQEEVLVVSQKTDNIGMSLVSPDEGITTTDAEPSPHEEETPCHRENSAHLDGEEYDVGGKCHMDADGGRELAYQGGNNAHEAPAVAKAESADSDLADDDDEMLREDDRSDDDGEMVEEPETAEASPVGSPKTGGAVFTSSRAEFDPGVQNKSFPPVSSMLDGDGLDKNVLQFHQSDDKDWAPSEHDSQHFQQLDNEKGASPHHHHTASDVPSQSQDGGSPAVESPEHIRGEVNVDTFTTSSNIPLDKTPASDRSVKFDLTPMEISQKGGLLSNLDDTLPALYELPSFGSNIFGGGLEETRSSSSPPLSAGITPYMQSPLVEDSLLVEGSNKVPSVPALPNSPLKLFPEMALHSPSGHEEASAVNHCERSSDGHIVGVLENGSTFKEYEKDGFASEEIASAAVVDGASHKVASKFKEAVPHEAHFSLSLSGNPFEEARAPLIEVSPTRADDTSQLFSAREESKMSISAASLSDRSVTPITDEAAIMAAVSASTTSLATSSFLDPFTAATTGDEVSPSLHAEVGSPHSTEVDESLSVSMEQVPASLPDPEQSHRDPSDPRPMSISPPEMSPRPSTLAEPRGALASIASNGPTEVDFSPFDVDVITPQSQFFQGNSPSPSSSATPSPVRVVGSMAEGLSEAQHRDAEADVEENEVDVEEEVAPPHVRAFEGLGGPNNHNDEDNVDDEDEEEEEDVDESAHDVDLCLVASCEFQHHREGLQHSGVTQSPVDFSDDSEHSQDRAKPADSFYRPSSNQYNSGGLSFGPSPTEETPPTSASESLPTRSDSDIPPGTEDCTAEAAQDSEDDSDCLPSDKTSSDKSNKSVRVDARSRIDASPSAPVDPFPPPPDPNVCMADPETQEADLDKQSKKEGKTNPKASAKGAKKPDGKAKPSAAQPKGAAGKEKPTSKPNKIAETKITKQDKEAKNGVNVNASRGGAGQTKATGTGAGKPAGLLASYPSGPHVYVDLAYVPNHCSAKTADVEFFRRVRSAHYVVSGNDPASEEPSRSVLDCLLEAKAQWGNNALQVTLIPTHDTEVMREWYQESHARLKELSIMVLASSSTVVMQEESFPACKIEF